MVYGRTCLRLMCRLVLHRHAELINCMMLPPLDVVESEQISVEEIVLVPGDAHRKPNRCNDEKGR